MHLSTVQIRSATPADAAEAIRLFGALHAHNASLDPRFALADDWQHLVEEYLREQTSADSVWLLGCVHDQAIGFVLIEAHTDSPLYRHRRWAEIVGLYVDPAYRGSGVARLLMDHAYDWAINQHLHVMQLYVTTTNAPAQRFYAKHGFASSQIIMRRAIDDGDAPDDPIEQPPLRLQFGECGARRLDMHERQSRR